MKAVFDETQKIPLLAVVGSTASGKSRLAVELAKTLNGEVVSCDSMQIYRRMNIGTAKPTEAEMEGVAHHLIDFVPPEVPFSCADYVSAARETVAEIFSRGKLPILCGGTGLYLERLLHGGGDAEESEPNLEIRAKWQAYAETNGNHALHERLREVDPASADAVHENNVHRVIRALEIFETTGIPKSEWDRRSKSLESDYDYAVIGLRYEDRQLLYRRIEDRVDLMMEMGLLGETETLMREGVFEQNATAAQAIGYKELLAHLRGEESFDAAVERLKIATRRYAKRQITWFSAKDYVEWIAADENGARRAEEAILADALEIVTAKWSGGLPFGVKRTFD